MECVLWQLLAGVIVVKKTASCRSHRFPASQSLNAPPPRWEVCLGRCRTSCAGPALTIIPSLVGLVLEICTALTCILKACTYCTNNCARFNAFGQSRPHSLETGHTDQKQITHIRNRWNASEMQAIQVKHRWDADKAQVIQIRINRFYTVFRFDV